MTIESIIVSSTGNHPIKLVRAYGKTPSDVQFRVVVGPAQNPERFYMARNDSAEWAITDRNLPLWVYEFEGQLAQSIQAALQEEAGSGIGYKA